MLLAANPGSPPQPLTRVASGGELARTMLALRLVAVDDTATDRADASTVVFDEVDAGIGGAAAAAVAEALVAVASGHQVLVVTHLAQVAARADHQITVSKRVAGGHTHTAARPIDGDARVDELARMLSGAEGGEAARQHAAQLLDARSRPDARGRGRLGSRPAGNPGNRTSETEAPMAQHIFVTGGVASSLGKGLTASSLGRLLKLRGLRVTLQKLDPYINVDPGTMNPFEHGEVFVTDDGGETDLDLGHYERFIDENLSRSSNATTGSIYQSVLAAERRGEYLGKTVQVIPHITDEIRRRIKRVVTDDIDVVITEVGGTVGDIEILPFLEAIRQFRKEAGRDNVCYIHVTLVPFIGPSGEQKTKPTQHSVTELRSRGIQPDVIVCRSEAPLSNDLKVKISNLCDVDVKRGRQRRRRPQHLRASAPSSTTRASTSSSVRGAPHRHRRPPPRPVRSGRAWSTASRRPTTPVRIGLIGKYVQLPDAYLSVVESIKATAHH